MNEQEMNRLIKEWNSKYPENKAAPRELLKENEKQGLIWCEETKEWCPMYTAKEKEAGTIVYKLNEEENFTYNPVFSDVTEEETGIGQYGRKWQEFMEANYPDTVLTMSINSFDWETVAQEVDKEAEELYRKLDEQYRKANPRPTTFWETAKWEKMRLMEIDHAVMEMVVLQFRNSPKTAAV